MLASPDLLILTLAWGSGEQWQHLAPGAERVIQYPDLSTVMGLADIPRGSLLTLSLVGVRIPGFDFNRRPDKRLDHRHHLIDAITLALTSRGLFQQMAKNYKETAEKMRPRDGESKDEREKRMKKETRQRLEVPEPPLRNVRATALEAVRECRISIKPDHHLGGRLFQDFAYRVIFPDGDVPARLARRKPVSDMAGDSIEQTRKNINDIVNLRLKHM